MGPTSPLTGRGGMPRPKARRLPPRQASCLLLTLAVLASGCAAFRSPAYLPEADRLLAAGEYEAAAQIYESHLEAGDGADGTDRALFGLALIRLLPESPLHDPAVATTLLERLVLAHPHSAYASSAAAMLALSQDNLTLEAEIERLRTQLDELRRIDLESGPGSL